MKRSTQVLATAGTVVALSVGLLVAGSLGGRPTGTAERPGPPPAAQTADPLTQAIEVMQARLKTTPTDFAAWAALAVDYVAQAKATVNPSYYLKAEGAVEKSLALDRKTNYQGFQALAVVKNGEHDFYAAEKAARAGIAINAYNSTLYGALGDALTQTDRYDEAAKAIDRMNRLLPGVPAFTRASYVFELRGDIPSAKAALDRALSDATTASDKAFAQNYLGELALNYGGDAAAALQHYEAGLAAVPTDSSLQAGRAKALAALDRTPQAVAAYRKVVADVPQPQYVLELGELEESLGMADAQTQYKLFRVEEDLFRANRVILDVEPTLFEADHGDPKKALAYAQQGWKARPFLEMADAYAWAEHVNGNDAAALGWASKASATGWRNALFLFHRGMIHQGLGDKAAAKSDLTAALELNPHFAPLQVQQAKKALTELG